MLLSGRLHGQDEEGDPSSPLCRRGSHPAGTHTGHSSCLHWGAWARARAAPEEDEEPGAQCTELLL